MKQIAKGKEPTPITELNKDQYASYALGNLLRGGGLGFMGDFYFLHNMVELKVELVLY